MKCHGRDCKSNADGQFMFNIYAMNDKLYLCDDCAEKLKDRGGFIKRFIK